VASWKINLAIPKAAPVASRLGTTPIVAATGAWNAKSRSRKPSARTTYDLEPHHQRLLQAACEAWDRLQEAREVLRQEGTYVEGRYGPRAHPAVAVERDSRVAFARLLRELDLDGEPGPDPRPPRR
jgi:phage terminase small subunit